MTSVLWSDVFSRWGVRANEIMKCWVIWSNKYKTQIALRQKKSSWIKIDDWDTDSDHKKLFFISFQICCLSLRYSQLEIFLEVSTFLESTGFERSKKVKKSPPKIWSYPQQGAKTTKKFCFSPAPPEGSIRWKKKHRSLNVVEGGGRWG